MEIGAVLGLISLGVGTLNGVALFLKPLARLHSRLDVFEVRLSHLERDVDDLKRTVYDDDR